MSTLPHRVELPGADGFSVWRTVLLRTTGFPARRVLALADEDLLEKDGPDFADVYAEKKAQAEAALRTAALDERFREAVVWQNRVLHDEMLRKYYTGEGPASRRRQKGKALARYLQRYCVKNDTIGYFGPSAWIRFDPDGASVLPPRPLSPRPHGVAYRRVCFEGWAVDALAAVLSEDASLKKWQVPRTLPFHGTDGEHLHRPLVDAAFRQMGLPGDGALKVDASDRALLDACDGERNAAEVASLLERPEDDVFARLGHFVQQGVLAWDFEPPMELYPERTLRRCLEKITDDEKRKGALDALDDLVAGRDAVARAAGDRAALSRALIELEKRFERRTDVSATRAAGQTYAGRTLVYEDCRLEWDARLGGDVLQRLGPPLGLVLQSARWLVGEVAAGFRTFFDGIYDELAESAARGRVDLVPFAARVTPLLTPPVSEALHDATVEMQRRWAGILSMAGDERRVERSSGDLAPRVAEAFADARPAWELARYVSPDVMIAARDRAAVEGGDYDLVLGEVHLFNTLTRSFIVDLHPDPGALRAAREADIPGPTVAPVPSKENNTSRMALALASSRDVWLRYQKAPPGTPLERTVHVGELFLERRAATLEVVHGDGRRWDVVEFFGYNLSNHCMSFPSLLAPAEHRPRLAVDDLVLSRESWSCEVGTLAFRRFKDPARTFRHFRDWARERRMPRFLFARVPGEPKPLYVDRASPIYVEMLLRGLRKADENDRLHLSEMLPAFGELWLTDEDGESYASELRLVTLNGSR